MRARAQRPEGPPKYLHKRRDAHWLQKMIAAPNQTPGSVDVLAFPLRLPAD